MAKKTKLLKGQLTKQQQAKELRQVKECLALLGFKQVAPHGPLAKDVDGLRVILFTPEMLGRPSWVWKVYDPTSKDPYQDSDWIQAGQASVGSMWATAETVLSKLLERFKQVATSKGKQQARESIAAKMAELHREISNPCF